MLRLDVSRCKKGAFGKLLRIRMPGTVTSLFCNFSESMSKFLFFFAHIALLSYISTHFP